MNDSKPSGFLELKLKGPSLNKNAIGAKVIVYAGSEIIIYEKSPARGFMSSMEGPLHIGIGQFRIDSMVVVWPDNTYQALEWKNSTNDRSSI